MSDAKLAMLVSQLNVMKNNGLGNYIVPGLDSWLIGDQKDKGKVRLFQSSRETLEFITPHSHRFGFTCLVLEGWAQNTLFKEVTTGNAAGEYWCLSSITQVCGINGILKYEHQREEFYRRYIRYTTVYRAGDVYCMNSKEIHSIKFSKGAKVLFFEGPAERDYSTMIEPWVGGKVVPTFKVQEDWMFEKL